MASSASATNFTITAQSSRTFFPPTLTIQVGDTVTFKNVGGGFHNVAADDSSFRCSETCNGSGGDPSSANWSFDRTFTSVGGVGFHCEVHGLPGSGMHGTITVTGSTPPPPPGSLQFSLAAYSVGEGTSVATIAVTRAGGSGGTVSVSYAATAGTATAGSDFTATSGTLSWASGDGASKTFGVTIKNDTLAEPTETVHLTLSSPTGGATLGLSSATLSILDNDSGGGSAPAAPVKLTATATELNSVTLTWQDKSNNETSFRVQSRRFGTADFADIATSAANSTHATAASLDENTAYEFRVRAENASGVSAFTASVLATTDTPPAPCVADAVTLCLGSGGRFQARINWTTAADLGPGSVIPLPANPDSGLFYFFAPSNIEALLKVLNACTQGTPRYWVFFAATTNVEFVLRVTDTTSGKQRWYFNPLNQAAAPVQDTNAFATCP
ncbi:MAG: Calx-beta domain-containing protein [Acidobacteriota bacterium]